jgi:hypothetical protein
VIDRLDDEDYAQSVVKIIAPPPSVRARGVHTLSCADALAVFDLIVPLRTAGMLRGQSLEPVRRRLGKAWFAVGEQSFLKA